MRVVGEVRVGVGARMRLEALTEPAACAVCANRTCAQRSTIKSDGSDESGGSDGKESDGSVRLPSASWAVVALETMLPRWSRHVPASRNQSVGACDSSLCARRREVVCRLLKLTHRLGSWRRWLGAVRRGLLEVVLVA